MEIELHPAVSLHTETFNVLLARFGPSSWEDDPTIRSIILLLPNAES